jgi:hypothetical protein
MNLIVSQLSYVVAFLARLLFRLPSSSLEGRYAGGSRFDCLNHVVFNV